MKAPEARRAEAAAISTATALDLSVHDAIVLNDSNRLVLRLMPCNVVVRVAPIDYQSGATELELAVAARLAAIDGPVAAPEPRVETRAYTRDGFVMSMWTHHEHVEPRLLPPSNYAHALGNLHAAMRQIDVTTPHFMDRVADTQRAVASRDVTPDLSAGDRELLAGTLVRLGRFIVARGAREQVLHGEPHPWNLLRTKNGLLFIDFENCVRGPVEFDLAWVPAAVSQRFQDADQELIGECRGLVLAIIAACRWRDDDRHPSGRRSGVEFLRALREGPPWPAVDDV